MKEAHKSEQLKGAFYGIHYPIIQIENLTELEKKKQIMADCVTNKNRNLTPYFEYCKSYIQNIDNERLISEPYTVRIIKDEIIPQDRKIPMEHRRLLTSNYNWKIKEK